MRTVNQIDTSIVDKMLTHYNKVKGSLISILHEIQSHYNYLPEDVLRYLSKKINVPITRLYSIATFYHFFSLTPKGRHQVYVCRGTACHVKGAQRVLEEIEKKLNVKEGETTSDLRYSVNEVRCIGACSFAPVIVIDKDTYFHVNSKKAIYILKKYE